MPSFQISISPRRRVAARFIDSVRQSILRALAEEALKTGITQSDVAREIGVHRSVINRELRGYKDMTLGRVAEFAYALGRKPSFVLLEEVQERVANAPSAPRPSFEVKKSADVVSIGAQEQFSVRAAA